MQGRWETTPSHGMVSSQTRGSWSNTGHLGKASHGQLRVLPAGTVLVKHPDLLSTGPEARVSFQDDASQIPTSNQLPE